MSSSLLILLQRSSNEKRDVKEVPFVELSDKRLQDVVSSGSDIERVYVSYFEVGTLDYYCNTNNNRPYAGLRSSLRGNVPLPSDTQPGAVEKTAAAAKI